MRPLARRGRLIGGRGEVRTSVAVPLAITLSASLIAHALSPAVLSELLTSLRVETEAGKKSQAR